MARSQRAPLAEANPRSRAQLANKPASFLARKFCRALVNGDITSGTAIAHRLLFRSAGATPPIGATLGDVRVRPYPAILPRWAGCLRWCRKLLPTNQGNPSQTKNPLPCLQEMIGRTHDIQQMAEFLLLL